MEDIEKMVEGQGNAEEELKELEKIELGLEPDAITAIAAKKRFEYAQIYQGLQVDSETLKASSQANINLGNKQAAGGFDQRVAACVTEMQHCLRAIKTIDKQYAGAKELMQKMLKNQPR